MPVTRATSRSEKAKAATELVGSLRRLGQLGPAYQVLSIEGPDAATIIVLESEERLVYPITKILADPEA